MAGEIFSVVVSLVLFIGVMIIFSRDSMDYVAYALFAAFLSCVVLSYVNDDITSEVFLQFVEFRPLIFIISMQIMVLVAEKHKIFQWIAVKSLHLTKGNHRTFFYLICMISMLSAAIIADVTVSIIFIPLVIRACRILKIKSAPYLFGITITINIGSILTPFSSSENILISDAFGLDFIWFIQNMGIFVIFASIITLVLLDLTLLKKESPPPEQQKKILMEIMNPNLVIINKKQFILNAIYFFTVIFTFIFIPESYLVAMVGAVLMSLLNRTEITDNLAKIDWKIIFFFISLFLLIGTMRENGTFDTIGRWVALLTTNNVLVASLVILILSSLLSGLLANSPTAIVFITIIGNLFPVELFPEGVPNPILIAFLLGINLGGNFLPQGAACDVMTLNIAKKNNVEGFTYNTLFKRGGTFALIHIGLCIIYILIYTLVTGAF